jgi:hypothetical protein
VASLTDAAIMSTAGLLVTERLTFKKTDLAQDYLKICKTQFYLLDDIDPVQDAT